MFINSEDEILDQGTRSQLIIEMISTENRDRRDRHTKRHDCFNDQTKEYVTQLMQEEGISSDSITEMFNRAPNLSILRKIIGKLARVYAEPPVRNVREAKEKKTTVGKLVDMAKAVIKAPGQTMNERLQETLDECVEDLELDRFMKKVNRAVELHKNVLIRVAPLLDREASIEAGKEQYKIGLELWNPSYYDVIPDPADGTRPMVVIFSYFDDTTQSGKQSPSKSGDSKDQMIADSAKDKGKDTVTGQASYVWYSPSYQFTTNGDGNITEVPWPDAVSPEEKIANPIGMLPFVDIQKDQDVQTFWATGGDDLVDTSIVLGLMLADANFCIKYQGHGLLVVAGKNVPKQLKVGPNRALTFDIEDGDPTPVVNFASTDPHTDKWIRLVETQLAVLLTTNNLEPGAISGKLDANSAPSGIADIISKSEPTGAIADEQSIYRSREPRIFKLAAAWAEVWPEDQQTEQMKKFKELKDVRYSLDLPIPEPFVSEEQKVNVVAKKKEMGAITQLMMIQELNPSLDEESAKALMEEIKAEKAENAAAFGVPMGDDKKPDPFKKDDDNGEKDKVDPVE